MLVQRLQQQLEQAGQQHECELEAMREQVRILKADAGAELEAAQSRLKLLRLKQQRMTTTILAAD